RYNFRLYYPKSRHLRLAISLSWISTGLPRFKRHIALCCALSRFYSYKPAKNELSWGILSQSGYSQFWILYLS
ncbi:hypothetical protein J6590_084390, partial [Homalodisca vitripennis]